MQDTSTVLRLFLNHKTSTRVFFFLPNSHYKGTQKVNRIANQPFVPNWHGKGRKNLPFLFDFPKPSTSTAVPTSLSIALRPQSHRNHCRYGRKRTFPVALVLYHKSEKPGALPANQPAAPRKGFPANIHFHFGQRKTPPHCWSKEMVEKKRIQYFPSARPATVVAAVREEKALTITQMIATDCDKRRKIKLVYDASSPPLPVVVAFHRATEQNLYDRV